MDCATRPRVRRGDRRARRLLVGVHQAQPFRQVPQRVSHAGVQELRDVGRVGHLGKVRGEDKRFLKGILGKKDLRPTELEKVRGILRACGAESAIRERATGLTEDARSLLRQFPANEYRDLLGDWLDYLIGRDR